MGTISIEKAGNLYWLGRYTERVYTTLRMFDKYYDVMIDQEDDAYISYCQKLSIPNRYKGKEDFIVNYLFDRKNPDSLYSNLRRAYDNAILLRNEISSEVLAYIQLSLNIMGKGQHDEAALLELQPIMDYLLAFWGGIDDFVLNPESRNIIKCGRYVERLDLYMRFDMSVWRLEREYSKLLNRIDRIKFPYHEEKLKRLREILSMKENWRTRYEEAIDVVTAIIEV